METKKYFQTDVHDDFKYNLSVLSLHLLFVIEFFIAFIQMRTLTVFTRQFSNMIIKMTTHILLFHSIVCLVLVTSGPGHKSTGIDVILKKMPKKVREFCLEKECIRTTNGKNCKEECCEKMCTTWRSSTGYGGSCKWQCCTTARTIIADPRRGPGPSSRSCGWYGHQSWGVG